MLRLGFAGMFTVAHGVKEVCELIGKNACGSLLQDGRPAAGQQRGEMVHCEWLLRSERTRCCQAMPLLFMQNIHRTIQCRVQMGGLLSAFKKQTGQDYTGDEQQTNMLSSLAHQVTSVKFGVLPPDLAQLPVPALRLLLPTLSCPPRR
jgi:hypothetical protein